MQAGLPLYLVWVLFIMCNKIEIWKPVPNYEGKYMVSSFGNVISLFNNKQKNLKQKIGISGYYYVGLWIAGKRKTVNVHSLVAQAFLGHKPDGTHKVCVDHKDNNKLNNNLYNLQLISNRENTSKDTKGSSKYVGVSWHKVRNKWQSNITIKGKMIYLGLFKCELVAHLAYRQALNKHNLSINN
jgi:hypothetical protein